MAALRRRQCYLLQLERLSNAKRTLEESLRAFAMGHDLMLILSTSSCQGKKRARAALDEINR